MTPKLVIFDCDGVLVDSEPITESVIAESLTQHGLPIQPSEVRELFRGGTMDGVEAQARAKGANLSEDWQSSIYAEMFRRFEMGVPLIPGILDLLDKIDHAGIATAVASNAPTAKMRVTLRASGLWERLSPNIYSRLDHAPKPAPDMLLHAMNVANVAPQDAIFIDDSPAGCAAGAAAGVKTFGLAISSDANDLADAGAIPVASLNEIATAMGLAP